jgi:hypothetical protein
MHLEKLMIKMNLNLIGPTDGPNETEHKCTECGQRCQRCGKDFCSDDPEQYGWYDDDGSTYCMSCMEAE